MNPSTVYCDNCGAANRPLARFCTTYGQAMQQQAAPLPLQVAAHPSLAQQPPFISAPPPQEARTWPPMGTTLSLYRGHADRVYAVVWSPDNLHSVSDGGNTFGQRDYSVQVWGAPSKKTLLTYRGHKGQVMSVAWSSDGTHKESFLVHARIGHTGDDQMMEWLDDLKIDWPQPSYGNGQW